MALIVATVREETSIVQNLNTSYTIEFFGNYCFAYLDNGEGIGTWVIN